MNLRSAADFFDRYAHDFAAIYGNENRALDRLINRFFRRSMRERYRRTLAACDPIAGRTVLDIGCGPGHYAVALAKRGAEHVTGIDFAPAMIELARGRAESAGVADRCTFIEADFMAQAFERPFDYTIVMGFMDYIADPSGVISRVAGLTVRKALFSFPVASGFLAWQRRWRYRRKTALYMYDREQVELLTGSQFGGRIEIERIGRDFFVTATGGALRNAGD